MPTANSRRRVRCSRISSKTRSATGRSCKGLLQAAAAANDEDNGAHYAEELAQLEQDTADNHEPVSTSLEALYKQNTEIIAQSIREIQKFERDFAQTKARVAVSRQLESLAGLMKSSVSELQGMLGGEMGQSMQQLRESAAQRRRPDARDHGSARRRWAQASRASRRCARRAASMLFEEYKKKMGMVQPEAATPAAEAPAPERQKIAE